MHRRQLLDALGNLIKYQCLDSVNRRDSLDRLLNLDVRELSSSLSLNHCSSPSMEWILEPRKSTASHMGISR